MNKRDVYFSGMLWLIVAFQIPHQYAAVIVFIIALFHAVAIVWMALAQWMMEDEIYDGLC